MIAWTAIKNFFGGAIKWITDPKNRTLVLILLVIVFLLLFLKQCNDIKALKYQADQAKIEATREINNEKALKDSVVQVYNKKTGEYTNSIAGLDITLKELNGKYADLFKEFQGFKNNPPKAVIETKYYITEKITAVPVKSSDIDSTGAGVLSFSSDTIFSSGNSRSLSGVLPYNLQMFNRKDSTYIAYDTSNIIAKVNGLNATLNLLQQMTLYTSLNRDKKTGQVSVLVKTNYPGVNFTVLRGATVEDEAETKKALQQARKPMGFGFHVGAGASYDFVHKTVGPSINVGVGFNFTPKIFQFGK